MIEVFRTNVGERSLAARLSEALLRQYPGSRVDFDLEDCDRVLRVEGRNICTETITLLLQKFDCRCEAME